MQEKESIISVRYGQTDKSVHRVTVCHHSAEPRDAKTVTLATDLSVRTSNSGQILIISQLVSKATLIKLCAWYQCNTNKDVQILVTLTLFSRSPFYKDC